MNGCAAALDIATPELYRRNLFRVLGLSVRSSAAEVRRRRKRLAMQMKLGIASDDGSTHPLALDPAPDETMLGEAMERLGDPQARLLDELFWIWPLTRGAKPDAALRAFESGDVAAACALWEKHASSAGRQGCIAQHNAAVMAHVQALDLEWRLLHTERSAAGAQDLERLWEHALSLWGKVAHNPELWRSVRARAQDLDDARLTTGFVRRLRETLPRVLLTVNARLALGAAERGDADACRRHRTVLEHMEFESGQAVGLLREVLRPIRDRVKSICRDGEEAAGVERCHGAAECRRILRDTSPLLATVDLLLPSDDPVRRGLHDDIAETALGCQVAYANETRDWASCLAVGDDLLAIVVGDAARERVKENLKIARENHEFFSCHFCGKGQSTEESVIELPMWGDLKRREVGGGFSAYAYGATSYEVTWNHGTVTVPRCPRCRRGHAYEFPVVIGAAVLASWVSKSLLPHSLSQSFALVVLAGVVVGGLVLLASRHMNSWGAASEARKHPAVRARRVRGWAVGTGPTEEQKQNAPIVSSTESFDARIADLRARLGL